MTAPKLEIRITQIYHRGKRGFSKGFTVDGSMGLKQAKKRLKDLMENPQRAPVVTGDYIADYWISEIQQQSELTIEKILKKIYHIQRNALESATNYRRPLVYIAEDHDVQLTDGSEIREPKP